MLAREKLLHAFFAPIGKSFHLKAKAGTHEVLYSQRVYLIDFQKGTVQDKNGRSEQRDSSTCQCTAVCALASCSAPVSHILPSRSDAQVALQSRKQTGSKHSGFTRNRTRPTRKSHPLLLLKKHPNATGNDGGDCRCAEKKGGKIRPAGTISREGMRITCSFFSVEVLKGRGVVPISGREISIYLEHGAQSIPYGGSDESKRSTPANHAVTAT
jgi:hypothetical protein